MRTNDLYVEEVYGFRQTRGKSFVKLIPEHKEKLRLSKLGKRCSIVTRDKIGNKAFERLGLSQQKYSIVRMPRITSNHDSLLSTVLMKLTNLDFRCIPIKYVIPDAIAIKNGKIYAIEVEANQDNHGFRKYKKMFAEIYFDKIMYFVQRRRKSYNIKERKVS